MQTWQLPISKDRIIVSSDHIYDKIKAINALVWKKSQRGYESGNGINIHELN